MKMKTLDTSMEAIARIFDCSQSQMALRRVRFTPPHLHILTNSESSSAAPCEQCLPMCDEGPVSFVRPFVSLRGHHLFGKKRKYNILFTNQTFIMNIKRLLLASVALTTLSLGAWADVTDVTDTYIKNAGFDEESDFVTAAVSIGDYNGVQSVNGWTGVTDVTWASAAVFEVGGSYQLNKMSAPGTNSEGKTEGGVLGFNVAWNSKAYYTQDVKLPAGFYTLSYVSFNANSTTTKNFGSNYTGFVPDEGTAVVSSTVAFAYNQWTTDKVSFTLTEETSGKIRLGFNGVDGSGSGVTPRLFVDYVKLEFQSLWEVYSTKAEESLNTNASGAETQRKALTEKLATESPTDEDALKLKELLTTFEDAIQYENTNATAIAEAEKTQAVMDSYPYSYEKILSSDISSWESSDYAVLNGGQHWRGVTSKYYEQTSQEYGKESWSHTAKQSVVLPKGKYAMFIAARASSGVTSTMSVKVGDNDAKTVTLPNNGDTGRGIDTSGKSTYAYDATYANNGAGRGWKYKYIEFETTEDNQTVVISFAASAKAKSQWVSIADPMLYGENSLADVYKVTHLKPALDAANAVKTDVNIGAGVFQRKSEAISPFTSTLKAAQAVYDDATLTDGDKVLETAEGLTAAQNTFAAAINLPNEADAYSIVMAKAGLGWTGKAATFYFGNEKQGGYAIAYSAKVGESNYVQSIHFVPVEGNTFKLYIIDQSGNKQYICDGKAVGSTDGWNSDQLRCTSNAEDALVISVVPSYSSQNIYELFNTNTGIHVGSTGNNGFYCSNDNYELNLVPAEKFAVERTVAAGKFGTIILPYAADVPEGTKVYSVESIGDDALTLTEVESIEACVPYIIGKGTYNFSDWPLGYKSSYADANGYLTGVLVATPATAGTYVLQTQSDVQAFYLVGDTKPTIAANRAYLTVPSTTSAALRISFGNETTTGVEAVKALTEGKAEIYDLSGRKLNTLRKGINIVNGVKVIVK
jgi:hypothetical protein